METPVILNCETIFRDTATEDSMTQIFSERVRLFVDYRNEVVVLFKDDNIIDKFSLKKDYTIQEFGRYQLQVKNLAESL